MTATWSPTTERATTECAATERAGTAVCDLDALDPERGVAALVDGCQVAVFLVPTDGGVQVHAIDNRDPYTNANVLARGLVGWIDGDPYVASPLHKQRFDLRTGRCLDDDRVAVDVWVAQVVDGAVVVEPPIGGRATPS